jgi:Flp pilus assembly protein TadB
MTGFWIAMACIGAAVAMVAYALGRIHGEDRRDERARLAAQDAEARRRGVAVLTDARTARRRGRVA